MIGKELLAEAKPNLRIVNVSRGGVIDEDALAEAIREGRIGGAAIDVFATRAHHHVAAVRAAAGRRHAAPRRQHRRGPGQGRRHHRRAGRAGPGRRVRAVRRQRERRRGVEHRAPVPAARRAPRPALRRARRRRARTCSRSATRASWPTPTRASSRLSVLKGVFGKVSEEPVSYVNAPRLAEERGIEVRESSSSTSRDYVNLVTIRGGDHAIGGTLVGLRGEPRIVMVDDHSVDVPPADHMLVVRNDDVPGMIAAVTGVVGEAGVNIDDMHLGRSEEGRAALMMLATDDAVSDDVQGAIRAPARRRVSVAAL